MTIRVLIVDDEPLARRRIRRLLRPHAGFDIIGECGNAEDAIEVTRRERPELLLVDVQMPGLDGFGLLAALGTARPQVVIFTTAFEEYAVKAFEVHALDYLVKPFSRTRFDAALERALNALRVPDATDWRSRAHEALTDLQSGTRRRRFLARRDGRTVAVDADDVNWIEADRSSVKLHTDRGICTLSEAISQLESTLDATRFVRVHRSAIVNVSRIVEVQPWFHGDAVLILRDGSRVRLSRNYRAQLSALFGTGS